MTKTKSSQVRANKRNARAKAKKIAGNKSRVTPSELRKKSFRRSMSGDKLEFDQVLANAVRQINKGDETPSEFETIEDLLQGIKKTASEVFKLYSYVTLVQALIKEGMIEDQLVVDLKKISLDLINIDKRVQNVVALISQGSENEAGTECLDIGTSLVNYSEELYAEIVRSEKHALIIEETLSRLAKDVEGTTDGNQQRSQVLESIAYQYLIEVKEEAAELSNTVAKDENQTATA